MDEVMPCNSVTTKVHDRYMHKISAIQEDVDFIRKHLNNPNFDLSHPPSYAFVNGMESTERYAGNSTYIDMSAIFYPFPPLPTF